MAISNSERVENLMSWVRILMPVALAGIGWYINQVVVDLEESNKNLAVKVDAVAIDYFQHKSSVESQLKELSRRIAVDEALIVPRSEIDRMARRIERLEDREHNIKENQ